MFIIHKVLFSLNNHKAAGRGGIAPIVLKNCAASHSFPLKQLFYRSYSKGICPSSWRFANITPVSPSDPSNYRPIAITSIFCKVMEKIVNRKLMSFLESRNLLDDRKYGFRSNRSTGDLMTYLTHKIGRSIQGYGESQLLSLDITKVR